MPDPEFVRVRLENGSEASVSPALARAHDLKPLDKPASRSGVALPAKNNPLKKTGAKASGRTSKKSTPDTSDTPTASRTAEKES